MSDLLPGWTLPDQGVLFIVSGPSGVGKSTLLREVVRRVPEVGFSVSATTRAPRPGEVDGVHYHFLDRRRFETLVAARAFLEHATVYDRCYGTLRAPVFEALDAGRSVLLDIDVQGADQVRASCPEAAWIYVLPPSLPALEARLRARATDDEETVRRRMAQAREQLEGAVRADYVVINDVLQTAKQTFLGIVLAEMSRRERRGSVVRRILDEVQSPR